MIKVWQQLIGLIFCLNQLIHGYRYKMSLTNNDNFDNCRNSTPQMNFDKFVNMDDLHITNLEDDEVRVDGTLKFLTSLGPGKWALEISTIYNDRGDWVPGPFHYDAPDACAEFSKKDSPWYAYTKKFNDQKCPPMENVCCIDFGF